MSVFIKICGLTDAAGIDAAVNAGANAIGFVFYEKSPRNLTIDGAIELSERVPDGILRVAVTLHPQSSLWDDIQKRLQPDALQTDIEAGYHLHPALMDLATGWAMVTSKLAASPSARLSPALRTQLTICVGRGANTRTDRYETGTHRCEA